MRRRDTATINVKTTSVALLSPLCCRRSFRVSTRAGGFGFERLRRSAAVTACTDRGPRIMASAASSDADIFHCYFRRRQSGCTDAVPAAFLCSTPGLELPKSSLMALEAPEAQQRQARGRLPGRQRSARGRCRVRAAPGGLRPAAGSLVAGAHTRFFSQESE